MSESQPKPSPQGFEVPDLELEPVVRSSRNTATVSAEPNLFDDDAFLAGSATVDLALDAREHAPQARSPAHPTNAQAWPSGVAPARDRLAIEPVELALLAGYGAAPTSPHLTPLYAYRVFVRQRELKHALVALDAEYTRAEVERQAALAELGRALAPELEPREQFRRLLSPLLELERTADQRGKALSSVSLELNEQASAIDSELEQIAARLTNELGQERDAQHKYDQRLEAMQRAEAKLKRVQIEVRSLVQLAEQKLGPQGEHIPEPEALRLAELRARTASLEPDAAQAKAELERAKSALNEASARVAAARRNERLAERKRLALVQHYQAELDARGRSLDETAEQKRSAFAELGRAVLAAPGDVSVPETVLAQLRAASERADALLIRCELHLRALDAYDRSRAAQGVKLAGTLAAIVLLLFALKIAL
ncbi:MAG TPA: hypothetical protein VHV51_14150 [Polyangiaceae bacterium]|jgi:chromosome segregation ATPase|nr:hypothetical protein [Polyangiaceae bacterium]